MHIFMCVCVCVCVCVIVCNQCLYKGGGTQERLTAVLFPGGFPTATLAEAAAQGSQKR